MLVHAALEHVPGRYRGGEGDDPAALLAAERRRQRRAARDGARSRRRARRGALQPRGLRTQCREGPLSDDAEPSPDTHYGAAKAELETFVREVCRRLAGRRTPTDRHLRDGGARGEEQMVLARPRRARRQAGAAARRHRGARATTWRAPPGRCSTRRPDAVAGRIFNCSDIVVSHRDIVRPGAQRLRGHPAPCRRKASSPKHHANRRACGARREIRRPAAASRRRWPSSSRAARCPALTVSRRVNSAGRCRPDSKGRPPRKHVPPPALRAQAGARRRGPAACAGRAPR